MSEENSNGAPKILTEDEVFKILKTLPSSRDQLALMVHLSVVSGWEIPKGDPRLTAFFNSASGDTQAPKIAGWIRKTWPGDTVRAKMAQKIADMIDKKEYLV
jgi:hypothetical protein